MRKYDAPLRRIGLEVVDYQCARAVAVARAAGHARFVEVFMGSLPPGPLAGTVWCNLDLLSIDELLWLAGVDSTGWTQQQYREFAMQEPA